MNDWILRLIALVIGVASPELRQALENAIANLEEQAKQTSNPWDDILVRVLKSLLLGH